MKCLVYCIRRQHDVSLKNPARPPYLSIRRQPITQGMISSSHPTELAASRRVRDVRAGPAWPLATLAESLGVTEHIEFLLRIETTTHTQLALMNFHNRQVLCFGQFTINC